ncbi:acyltransferase [Bacillus sp. EB600]|uniref:acyltransferase family protein n=1 Tax=Bacillus sp. EB600 TaxID=2806345 RepID=UPI00210BA76B|nr:acyltransferase [Bacillus sp. EB600]MCQ6278883.1 acyltransferase [Bacillus sp. EB600]
MKNLSLHVIEETSVASNMLDIIRFLSALVVFLFHFYVPLPGYQAVMVFFVLSGYFISGTILKSIKENKWKWSEYLIKRIIRLWVVLLPCLFLTYLWANLQLNIFGPNQKIANYLDVKTFLGNLFFLQGILVKTYGLNGPLWSLSYEFWYYILFPCLVLTFVSRKKKFKLLYAFLFILISLFVGKRIMIYFLIWLMGAVIPFIKPLKIQPKFLKNVILILTSLVAIFSTQYNSGDWEVKWTNFARDLGVAVSFCFLIYLIISFHNNKSINLKINISKHLAGFSYTLYLAHYPLANFILTWLMTPLWPFGKTTLALKLVIAVLVILYSWCFALLTERQTEKVRKFIFTIIFKNYSERTKTHSLS